MATRKPKTAAPEAPIVAPPPVANLPAVIAPATLDEMAAKINMSFKAVDTAEIGMKNARIETGKLLIEVRDRLVEAAKKSGGDGRNVFAAWFKKHINRSKSDIYACIKLASAPDPVAAVKAERATARASMATTRANRQSETFRTEPSAATVAGAQLPNVPVWQGAIPTHDALSELKITVDTLARLLEDARTMKLAGTAAIEQAIAAMRAFLAKVQP